MTTQPLPDPLAARPISLRDERAAARLLRLWVQIARRTVSAASHCSEDEFPLWDQQLAVEERVLELFPESAAQLSELIAWELSLMHDGDASTPVESCLLCKRARLQLPPGLPFPARSAGSR
jgi:hypothetical protein